LSLLPCDTGVDRNHACTAFCITPLQSINSFWHRVLCVRGRHL